MASHGIRGSTLAAMRSNVENETVGPRGKNGVDPMGAKGRVTRATRTAMTDIGNKANALQNAKNINAKATGFKKEAVKPARVLTKQKASTSLVKLSDVTRVTRRASAEAQKIVEEEQMDISKAETNDVEMQDVEAPPSGYSTELMNVDNIDKDDIENPQLVVEYVNEIYGYLRHLENVQNVREDYLNKSSGTMILPKMRAVLVDWLIQVHQQFNLLQETLYLTVAILDRFLQITAKKIERKQLQLVGVAAMFIASKYEEMYAPEIGDFVYITDRAYTESQIREMELRILSAINFELGRPLPLHFLRRNSKAGNVDALTHTLAKYTMELTLTDYKMAHVKPSMIAAAALALSLKVLDNENKSMSEIWTPTLVHYTSYSLAKISETVTKLANLILSTCNAPESAKLMAVRKKYEDKKMSKIAKLPELTGEVMEQLALGQF